MKKTVMVVDDERDVRESVKTVLEKEGYKVVAAVDGDDCLQKLQKQKVDLVLLDIMMPGTHVKEVVKKIRGPKIAYLSVVRVSEAEKEDLFKTNKISDFIEKPFNIKDLIFRVKKLIG